MTNDEVESLTMLKFTSQPDRAEISFLIIAWAFCGFLSSFTRAGNKTARAGIYRQSSDLGLNRPYPMLFSNLF